MQKPILFKKGILGFDDYKEYVIVRDEENCLYYLQSIDNPNLEFIIISPHVFKKPYNPKISELYFEELGGGADDEFVVYLMVRTSGKSEEITVNLQAPLLIHLDRRQGVQVIVDGDEYGMRESLRVLIEGGDSC
ncbi:MAG: hypothetical protein BEN18_02265 [Epulopiscium sp. Nuni2H_MBin001]|nr:MAG: hypothetical protein BEN18_02265 [Epulopiscium sp. Nuni2H_MBin001]